MARLRFIFLALSGLVALGLGLFYLSLPKPRPASGLIAQSISFRDLAGWDSDDHRQSLVIFQRTCARLGKLPADSPMGGHALYGNVSDWSEVCASAQNTQPDQARHFFETRFRFFSIREGHNQTGLFTGYYESEVRGSRHRHDGYQTPLLARPDDLVDVDLGAFAPDLKGRRTAGRINEKMRLVPYPDRAAIEAGSLGPRARALVWIDDPVDAFFMEIQGSGRVVIDDGSLLRLTFSGQNGQAYTAIGQVLIKRGELRREQVSMATIRHWLDQHPAQRQELLAQNRSYVFFQESPIQNPQDGPPGADGLSLTAGRSLAVDRSFHALGVPVFLDAEDAAGLDPPLRRLMITQDTGGAIRGIIRGDVFWGFGADAAARAGRMKDKGQLFILLPIPLGDKLAGLGK